MPAWEDIRPSALKAQLSIIWAWKLDRQSGEFVGRLAGERIQAAFKTTIRGARMSDVFPAREYERMLARHMRVAREPAFFRGSGLVFRHLDRIDIGERVILPLAGDGENGDGIIGATDFTSYSGMPDETLLNGGEREQWFTLD